MRVAEFSQLSPDRHPFHPAPGLGQLLHGRVLLRGQEGLELLRVRDLVRMATLIADFCPHIARRLFARQPPRIVSRCTPKIWLASFTSIPCSTAAITRIRKS